MHGCDELFRLPEEENKSLVSRFSTVAAWVISIVYLLSRQSHPPQSKRGDHTEEIIGKSLLCVKRNLPAAFFEAA
jgi:hypothetical protein